MSNRRNQIKCSITGLEERVMLAASAPGFDLPSVPSFDLPAVPSFDLPTVPSFDFAAAPGADVAAAGAPGFDFAAAPGVGAAAPEVSSFVEETGFSINTVNQPFTSLTTDQTPSELVDEAAAGNLYYNVHTEEFPGGEIRGQLNVVQDTSFGDNRIVVLEASLDAAQEPGPLSDSDATGTGRVVLIQRGDEVTYSSFLSVDGISSEELLPVAGVSPIHIHNAPAGVNGPVVADVVLDAGGDVNGLTDGVGDTGDGDVVIETFAPAF